MTTRNVITGPLDFEQWKNIPDCPGYAISDFGRVISFWKQVSGTKTWEISNVPHFLSPTLSDYGYPIVHLSKAIKRGTHQVHVLMLQAFIGSRPIGMWCRHLDDVKTHSHLPNLCWGTPSQNMHDRVRNGRNVKMGKLSFDDVREIRKLLSEGHVQKQIAKRFNVAPTQICAIKAGRKKAYVV